MVLFLQSSPPLEGVQVDVPSSIVPLGAASERLAHAPGAGASPSDDPSERTRAAPVRTVAAAPVVGGGTAAAVFDGADGWSPASTASAAAAPVAGGGGGGGGGGGAMAATDGEQQEAASAAAHDAGTDEDEV